MSKTCSQSCFIRIGILIVQKVNPDKVDAAQKLLKDPQVYLSYVSKYPEQKHLLNVGKNRGAGCAEWAHQRMSVLAL
jgi:hypothetical protein